MTAFVPCVLVPTYDNPRTVDQVVRGALAHCPRVVLIDDGSGPEAARAIDALAALPGVSLVRHERNLGKGKALRSGFQRARELGCTHGLAIDADGQHPLEQVPLFLRRAEERPEALLIGDRDLAAAGAGRGSTWGRKNSNFWTWVETGRWIPDTQSGFRCYPLKAVEGLALRCRGYDLEVEVLVKLLWTGTPAESLPIPVRYFQGPQRVSHMRPVRDFLKIGRLNTRLVTARLCLPAPVLDLASRRAWRESGAWKKLRYLVRTLAEEPGTPARAAASVALGLFMGIAPFWGLQMTLALLMAHLLNLSKPIALLATNVSFPLMIPFVCAASLFVGRLALQPGSAPVWTSDVSFQADLVPYVVGAFLLAVLVSGLGAGITFLVLQATRWRRAGSSG